MSIENMKNQNALILLMLARTEMILMRSEIVLEQEPAEDRIEKALEHMEKIRELIGENHA